MSQKAPPAGWVVQVAVPAAPATSSVPWIGAAILGAPTFQYYNVGIASSETAVEATSAAIKKTGAATGEMRTVRQLSAAEFEVLKLKDGEVRPA